MDKAEHPTRAAAIIKDLERNGPSFAPDIAARLGTATQPIVTSCVGLVGQKKIAREMADVPAELHSRYRKSRMWRYSVPPAARETKPKAPAAPRAKARGEKVLPATPNAFKPLKGNGLAGRPIVPRPGSLEHATCGETLTLNTPAEQVRAAASNTSRRSSAAGAESGTAPARATPARATPQANSAPAEIHGDLRFLIDESRALHLHFADLDVHIPMSAEQTGRLAAFLGRHVAESA